MSTQVSDLLTLMARHLQEEDSTFGSGLWSKAEVIEHIADMDVDFIKSTGVVKDVAPIPGVASQAAYDEPTQSVETERLSWNGLRVYPTTQFEMDAENPDWRGETAPDPNSFHRDNLTTKKFAVSPVPSAGATGWSAASSVEGVFRTITGGLTYSATGTQGIIRQLYGTRNYLYGARNDPNGTGMRGVIRRIVNSAQSFWAAFTLLPDRVSTDTHYLATPDAFVRYVMYGALAQVWGKQGDGQDLRRSAYCQMRYERGIALGKMLMRGPTV